MAQNSLKKSTNKTKSQPATGDAGLPGDAADHKPDKTGRELLWRYIVINVALTTLITGFFIFLWALSLNHINTPLITVDLEPLTVKQLPDESKHQAMIDGTSSLAIPDQAPKTNQTLELGGDKNIEQEAPQVEQTVVFEQQTTTTPPWSRYARSPSKLANSGKTPLIALVVSDFGINRGHAKYVLERLPAEITIALSPYSDEIDSLINLAREKGHELLLELPVESYNFPDIDPGANALLTSLSPQENLLRLREYFEIAKESVGLIIKGGGKFLNNPDLIELIMTKIAANGFLYVEDGTAIKSAVGVKSYDSPQVRIDLVVDRIAMRDDIRANLARLEALAKTTGSAIGIFSASPVVIDVIMQWLANLEHRGYALSPLTFIVKQSPKPHS